MSTGSRRPRRRARHRSTHSAQLARDWAGELASAGLIHLTRAELELQLRRPLDLLLTTLWGSPFLPHHAREVGAQLIELQADQSEALRRTYLLLSRRLTGHGWLGPEISRDRVDRLLAELIVGWVDAQHAATLTAQENLRRAADTARRARDTDPATPTGPWFG